MLQTISIVIPVYNVEKYICRCVDSVLSQTYKDFQLILVDDGSSDNSGTICDEYAKKDDRIIVVHQKNAGPSAARNAGLEWVSMNTNSEWVSFVDSDDWIHPKYLEWLLFAAEELSADLVIGEYVKTKGECVYAQNVPVPICVDAEWLYCRHQIISTVVWGKLCKVKFFERYLFPDGIINEDEYITYKLLFEADSIAYIQTPLYYYYENAEGIMSRLWSLKSLDAIGGYEEQLNYFQKGKYKKAYHSASDRYIGVLRYHLHQLKLVHPDERKRINELEFKLKWMTMKKYIQKKKQTLSFLLKKR